ncbi:MAG: ribbon-helix-helix domain-containing protein [Pseudomonadota bacterium]|nr:ribbon-helix-helix domain-containing protein [Pseudomonadota bacterium]
MPSRPRKRSLMIAGHPTSLSLEDNFWRALLEVAASKGISVATLIEQIDKSRGHAGLSGAVRVYLLEHYRDTARRSG